MCVCMCVCVSQCVCRFKQYFVSKENGLDNRLSLLRGYIKVV